MNHSKNIFDISDKGLIDSLKDDDQNAFKEIYKRYWEKLYLFAYKIIKDKDICEDIIQEVFTDLWIRRKEKEIGNISAYLYKAVKFQVFNQFRKMKLVDKHVEEFDNFISQHNLAEYIEYKDIYSRVETEIVKLPEQRRIIFQLSRDEGLSNKEIAQKLNISVQTVKNQISHALKSIRSSIKSWIVFFI
ncbi:MAG: RNA polymerase sigma-70 factor [Ignavibacteriaceae bacterium]